MIIILVSVWLSLYLLIVTGHPLAEAIFGPPWRWIVDQIARIPGVQRFDDWANEHLP